MAAVKPSSSINVREVEHFSGLAAQWWDANGPMRPLHQMKPARLHFIEAQVKQHLGRELNDISILDVGCGAGIMSEALAERGARVTGLDASAELIDAAKAHGKGVKNLTYRCGTLEEMGKEKFDLVLALEVIEHVNTPQDFVKNCAAAKNKNGLAIFSTLNRTPKSFLVAVVGAEYVLRVIPRGTHDWRKFVKPSELIRFASEAGLQTKAICGLTYNPLNNRFSLDESNVAVDYLLSAS